MFKTHQYYVYIMTNKYNTVLYVGVTNDLKRRVWEHKEGIYKGFSKLYNCNKLAYFEDYQWIQDAISREKQLKAGPRQNKVNLVIADNPEWHDLSDGWYE
jgi:putative endonuclease